nr:hypothetical protein [Actinomycetota bacterium]
GGYWVAEAVPGAAHHAIRAQWPLADVSAVIMASDGVSCAVDEYALFPTWTALLDLITTDGPQAVLDTVREAERADPDGTRWPRPKIHDDQALVHLDFSR